MIERQPLYTHKYHSQQYWPASWQSGPLAWGTLSIILITLTTIAAAFMLWVERPDSVLLVLLWSLHECLLLHSVRRWDAPLCVQAAEKMSVKEGKSWRWCYWQFISKMLLNAVKGLGMVVFSASYIPFKNKKKDVRTLWRWLMHPLLFPGLDENTVQSASGKWSEAASLHAPAALTCEFFHSVQLRGGFAKSNSTQQYDALWSTQVRG